MPCEKHDWLFAKEVRKHNDDSRAQKAAGVMHALWSCYMDHGRRYVCANCGDDREVY